MKFGVREICDVVLKAKANQKVGDKIFYKGEPVIYFDTLKTSSMEGAATTVYAQGGRGNSRLVAWEGERTITFTMEDALISPAGFMILSGAGLVNAKDKTIYVHSTEQTKDVKVDSNTVTIKLSEKPHTHGNEDLIYVMVLDDNGEVATEPYIASFSDSKADENNKYSITVTLGKGTVNGRDYEAVSDTTHPFVDECVVLVDYYVARNSGAQQIEITPDKFGGTIILKLLHYSVQLMVQICLQNLLFLTVRFSLTLLLQWLLVVIHQALHLQWMPSLITQDLIRLRKFLQQFKLLMKQLEQTY